MSIYVVGESPTVESFELIGIPGRALDTGEHVAMVVSELARSGAQLVHVQSAYVTQLTEDQLDQLGRRFGCLVLAIPGIGQPLPDAKAFRQWVQRSIGVLT